MSAQVVPYLQVGQNVLAIHSLNLNNSSDMLISPELVAKSVSIVNPEQLGYFDSPTPGYGNGETTYAGYVP